MEGDAATPPERSRQRDSDARPPVDRPAALRRAKSPAVALLAVGLFDLLASVLVMLAGIGGSLFPKLTEGVIPPGIGGQEVAVGFFQLLASLAVLAGGVNLLRLDAYGLVKTGCLTAMLPCVSICPPIVGFPVGVWALVTANSPDVWAAFRSRKR